MLDTIAALAFTRPLTPAEMRRFVNAYMEREGITARDDRATMSRRFYKNDEEIAVISHMALREYGDEGIYHLIGGKGSPRLWVFPEEVSERDVGGGLRAL